MAIIENLDHNNQYSADGISRLQRLISQVTLDQTSVQQQVIWHYVEQNKSSKITSEVFTDVTPIGYPLSYMFIHVNDRNLWVRFRGTQDMKFQKQENRTTLQMGDLIKLEIIDIALTDKQYDDSDLPRVIKAIEELQNEPEKLKLDIHFFYDPLVQHVEDALETNQRTENFDTTFGMVGKFRKDLNFENMSPNIRQIIILEMIITHMMIQNDMSSYLKYLRIVLTGPVTDREYPLLEPLMSQTEFLNTAKIYETLAKQYPQPKDLIFFPFTSYANPEFEESYRFIYCSAIIIAEELLNRYPKLGVLKQFFELPLRDKHSLSMYLSDHQTQRST